MSGAAQGPQALPVAQGPQALPLAQGPQAINFWSVLVPGTTPKLRSPNAIPHNDLKLMDSQGRQVWYYIEHFLPTGGISHKSIMVMTDIATGSYKFLKSDGALNPLSYNLSPTDKVYKCMYAKCQPSGTPQEGGKSKKRYPKTKKRKGKKARKSQSRRKL